MPKTKVLNSISEQLNNLLPDSQSGRLKPPKHNQEDLLEANVPHTVDLYKLFDLLHLCLGTGKTLELNIY
jgi:hypothetical protein